MQPIYSSLLLAMSAVPPVRSFQLLLDGTDNCDPQGDAPNVTTSFNVDVRDRIGYNVSSDTLSRDWLEVAATECYQLAGFSSFGLLVATRDVDFSTIITHRHIYAVAYASRAGCEAARAEALSVLTLDDMSSLLLSDDAVAFASYLPGSCLLFSSSNSQCPPNTSSYRYWGFAVGPADAPDPFTECSTCGGIYGECLSSAVNQPPSLPLPTTPPSCPHPPSTPPLPPGASRPSPSLPSPAPSSNLEPPASSPAGVGPPSSPPVREPCFPGSATLTLPEGGAVRVDALRAGDQVVGVTADARVVVDTISIFSLAHPTVDGEFVDVHLEGENGRRLSLTGGHHLPVGESCCEELKRAEELMPGDAVWVVGSDSTLEQRRVKLTSTGRGTGLHNPLLVHGSLPVVDGVVTSFNSLRIVRLDSWLVPPLEAACRLSGSCDALRRAVSTAECALGGRDRSVNTCQRQYIDGLLVHYDSKK